MPTPVRRVPLNTYRLQLHAGFTFADAAAQLDYLVELGVTDLYLSPILESAPGSTHGYDVIDPTRISDERGGRAGFEALATEAHARGLGVVVDIVPNHMAIPTPLWLNPMLWSALRNADSPYADWFDIEPEARLVLPNLPADVTGLLPDRPGMPETSPVEASRGRSVHTDEPIPALIAGGRLRFADLALPDGCTQHVLTLDGQPYPLVPGTEQLPLAEAVTAQRYDLQRWQGDHTRLTHRRFFDIVTLIGLRQELDHVFDATHALLLELFHAGHIDGFRVDHPDGLADPQAYFERLYAATGGAWVAAEKILSGDELLPPAWPVAGATGYEASWRFDAVQLDPDAAPQLARLAQTTDEQPTRTWAEVAIEAKRQIADGSLAIDLDRLTRLAMQLDPGLDGPSARRCLRELLVALDRYRAYIRPGRPIAAEDAQVLADAARRAQGVLAAHDHSTLTRLHDLAAGTVLPGSGDLAAEFVVRFQQVTGALVAKGVEDTAFYRWTQLLTLCEVGADPGHFGFPSHHVADGLDSEFVHRTRCTNSDPAHANTGLSELHAWLGRVNRGWPATMSSGSTHDSKRSEDVRARISTISEYPAEWAELVTGLNPLAGELPAPLRTILWQTLAGTWTPAGPIEAERIVAHCIKAGREQKLWTSWFSPDDAAEAAVERIVPGVLAQPQVQESFADWADLTAGSVRTNTLATKLVQLTALGVADSYQGQETVRLSLTDPDNRRAVDFGALHHLLAAISSSDDVQLSSYGGSGRQIWQPDGLGDESCTQDDAEQPRSATEHGVPLEAGQQPGAPRHAQHEADGPATRSLAEEKLLLTHLALKLRERHPEAFLGGSYLPLSSTTEFAWGFARGDQPTAVTISTRLPRARHRAGGWQLGDQLGLPDGTWHNLLTGRVHTGAFRPAADLGGWPCALLEQIE